MEREKLRARALRGWLRSLIFIFVLISLAATGFSLGFSVAKQSHAAETREEQAKKEGKKIVYKKETKLDFEGMEIEGQLKKPADFYFEHREKEKFDSLVERRKDFHRRMLRDTMMTR